MSVQDALPKRVFQFVKHTLPHGLPQPLPKRRAGRCPFRHAPNQAYGLAVDNLYPHVVHVAPHMTNTDLGFGLPIIGHLKLKGARCACAVEYPTLKRHCRAILRHAFVVEERSQLLTQQV